MAIQADPAGISIATASPRERVETTLKHTMPDRVPVDFLAVPEIWDAVIRELNPDPTPFEALGRWLEPAREAVLCALEVDCRVVSYDMFLNPPPGSLPEGHRVEWWSTANRSTPNRMWRRVGADGLVTDIWGVNAKREQSEFGAYESYTAYPLSGAKTAEDVARHPWPEADWWDFSEVPEFLDTLRQLSGDVHLRYRMGSVFEIAWQLYGMEAFLVDIALNPEVPAAIMGRLTDLHVAHTCAFLEQAEGRVGTVYFYDDVATENSLLMSPDMWQKTVREHHKKLINAVKAYDVNVMYHCDGSIAPLIPELLELGVEVLNPIQTDASGMDPQELKADFGDRLTFHGGVSIVDLLPRATPEEVRAEVRRLVGTLGQEGGYILAPSHHIQADTPIENVLAMYERALRTLPDI